MVFNFGSGVFPEADPGAISSQRDLLFDWENTRKEE